MAKDAAQGEGIQIAPTKQHLVWEGTSASAPYAAGVIALIFQKNPKLDASHIRAILANSASADKFTGSVPNSDWGYGKINIKAALDATPLPKGK